MSVRLPFGVRIMRSLFITASCALLSLPALAVRVTHASPQGEVPQARQVRLAFDAPVVRFGDPQLADPAALQCQPAITAGRGRWTSDREWVLDLPAQLPPGTRIRARWRAICA